MKLNNYFQRLFFRSDLLINIIWRMGVIHVFKNIGWVEISIVALVVLILFGSSKIPEFARGLINFFREIKKSFKDGTSSK